MAGAEARLDEAGVSLWLTDWKPTGDWTANGGKAWSGRRILTLVGGEYAGQLDFYVHPDRQAVFVSQLEVAPEYQRRNLASVMMDALYGAYPRAWINHGVRSRRDGTLWWDRYSEPAPERNVHNRPPAEWAAYFEAPVVAEHKAANAELNYYWGVDGHRRQVYRYGERLEEEAQLYAPFFRKARRQGPDPAAQELYAAVALTLPPGLHRLVHDSTRDTGDRARILLDNVGHGNLPCHAAWNTTEHAAFEDVVQDQLLYSADPRPGSYMVFRVLPLSAAQDAQDVALHSVKATWVTYINSPGIEVQLAGLSWRSSRQPWTTHHASFTPPVGAAIAPENRDEAGPQYRARFDDSGELLPGQQPQPAENTAPLAGREADIRALAGRLLESTARRTASPPTAPAAPRAQEDHRMHQQHSLPPPSPRPH
ncbi:hypothetical protein [Streptomyces sp. NPDC059003]|uniref:hypothetical protein n=1 Tax=Streptomyces sp. NPDC059003 TaxID=3346691 RepID=UPI0036BC816A